METALRTIKFLRAGHVGTLRLARPNSFNAISREMLSELDGLVSTLPDDLRVLLLTGEGKAFCAGVDLSVLETSRDADGLADFLRSIQSVFARLRALPFPVVAGVNGLALAGGLELALCADVIVASQSARFGDSHTNYGVVPGAGNCAILPRIVGPVIAKYLQFTGLTMSSGEMLQAGLVAKIWSDETFEDEFQRLGQLIAEKAPLANRHMKRLTDAAATEAAATVLAREIEANVINLTSRDLIEGMRAFAEKRKPVFQGT